MNIRVQQQKPLITQSVQQTPKSQEGISPQEYDQPPVEDLFEGSKPKFGEVYNKYIASTQVPHPEEAGEYLDEAADAKMAASFYSKLDGLSGDARMKALRELVTSSHTPEPKGYHFNIAKNLYTVVDRRPDGTVRDIYSQEPVQFLKYPDISLDTLSEKDLSAISGALTSAPEVVAAWMGFQRGNAELNCEHVVPQSWYNKQEPMRSDLHHLYSSDIQANSRRGNTPYGRYVPEGGKGEVARATLYFMLRYPDVKMPYNSRDVEMLKGWSEADPPNAHEKHRNHEIQKIQGNRNPFIDHPEWLKDFKP